MLGTPTSASVVGPGWNGADIAPIRSTIRKADSRCMSPDRDDPHGDARAGEQQLRLALRIARMITWEWNIATGELRPSRELEAILAPPPGGSGHTIQALLDLIHPDDLDRVWDAIQRAIQEQGSLATEFRVVLPDGKTRWWSSGAEVVRDESGQQAWRIGVAWDITERKEAEERLRETEQRFRTLVEQLPVASYVEQLDEESPMMYVSPQIADLVGYTAEEWVADPTFFARAVHPEDRERALAGFRSMHESGEAFDCEYRLVARDGRVVWVHDAAVIVRDQAGQPTRRIGVAWDITERRQAEERLRETEQRFRTLVEQLPLASYVEQLDGESATYVSPQIADLVGYTAEEWVADPTFFARVLHPEDRERVLAGFRSMHESGEAFGCEYRLVARDGRVVWVHDAAAIVRDQAGQPLFAQGYMIDISERKEAEQALQASRQRLHEQMEEMEHQALHDGLTDLPNRTLFRDRVEQLLRQGRRDGSGFAVMLLDLDRFKEVNDTLGHQSGDLLLREVAVRLRRALRTNDTVARLGGDEFGVLAPGLSAASAARALAEKLRHELGQPAVVGGLTIEVEASVGIAIFPEHGDDVETLLRHADISMYVSKNTHVPMVYAAAYDRHSRARLALVSDLRHAIDSDELVVHYQPQADTTTGEVHKVEALVRWQHPEHGLLGPDEFIPLAERTGLIRALTNYVLDTALGQCRAWRDEGRVLAVAVNITGRELMDMRFPDEVADLLAKWQVKPALLELEITESTVMTDLPRARHVLARLSGLGIRLAVDDFGSGHSSLGYLKRLPFKVLKIDKSFVQNMAEDLGDEAIVRSAIDLGHSLGLEIVAEGVETEEARRRLQELGCDTLQGYHLGRPQLARAFHETAPQYPEHDQQLL
jgi:diguanylate cyclase (GGDEF)-like protein/PAS domain S-box-containing protein